MTPVGVVVTTRGRERVNVAENGIKSISSMCFDDGRISDVHFAPVIKAKAMTLLTLMGKPTFVVALVVLDRTLQPLQLPTKLLQGTELEVLSAYSMMSAVIQVFFIGIN